MANVHFMIQPKGGAGKSTMFCFFLQWLVWKGIAAKGIDTDGNNQTFESFKALDVISIDNLVVDNEINPRAFDYIADEVFMMEPGGHVLIDNGASTYFEFISYLTKVRFLQMLQEEGNGGHRIFIHTVISGGSDLSDTVRAMSALAKKEFPEFPMVVWLNEHKGKIMDGEKTF